MIVYVIYNQMEVMMMVDCIVVMDDGEFQQVVFFFECYYELNNLFVVEFIGELMINFVCGMCLELMFVGEYFLYLFDEDVMEFVDDCDDFVLGVCFEDIEVVDVVFDDVVFDDYDFQMDVIVVEFYGDQNVFYFLYLDQFFVDDVL